MPATKLRIVTELFGERLNVSSWLVVLLARGCVIFFPACAQHFIVAQQSRHGCFSMFETAHALVVRGAVLRAITITSGTAAAILFTVANNISIKRQFVILPCVHKRPIDDVLALQFVSKMVRFL